MAYSNDANLILYEKTVKDYYLPVVNNQLGISPTALLAKIRKAPLYSNIIVTTAPLGLSGGFGFGTEGGRTPAAGGQMHERFTVHSKDMYVNITVSNKALTLVKERGAMVDVMDTEMKAAYATAEWNVGRTLFGDGDGILAEVSEGTDTSVTVKDVSKLKEGLIVDFYASGTDVPVSGGAGRRILAIDRSKKTLTLAPGDSLTLSDGAFVTVQNSYKNEITGLGAIFNPEVKTLYGISKEENPFLNPVSVDAQGDISDELITGALRQSQRDKNGNVDMLLCGDKAYDNWSKYLRERNYRVEEMTHELKGGFKAIKFLFGNKEVDVVNEQFVPDNSMWGVDTSAITLHQSSWKLADANGSGAFNLMENSSVYRALLANYGELICSNPGSCVEITNVAA